MVRESGSPSDRRRLATLSFQCRSANAELTQQGKGGWPPRWLGAGFLGPQARTTERLSLQIRVFLPIASMLGRKRLIGAAKDR